jgi:hypothetical protein
LHPKFYKQLNIVMLFSETGVEFSNVAGVRWFLKKNVASTLPGANESKLTSDPNLLHQLGLLKTMLGTHPIGTSEAIPVPCEDHPTSTT